MHHLTIYTTMTCLLFQSSSIRGFAVRTRTASSSLSRLFASNLSSRLNGLDKPTVWHEFSPLAVKYGASNLGQGFPDWDPPAFCIDAMRYSTDPKYGRNANQYARSSAHMPLAHVLAEEYSNRWSLVINPATQIATATGCTNALYCALQGLLNPGDQVLLLEPAFDIYASQVKMAGGVTVYCPLRQGDLTKLKRGDSAGDRAGANQVFTLDLDELESKITDKTRVLLLNSPHNPTGKIFSRQELKGISKLLEKYPAITVISDEVYEHIIFDPMNEPHISIATLPGMFDKTLTLSSSGKTFSCTGWKVGWAVGPPHLVKAVSAVQQWVNFSAATPTQDAIAQALSAARDPYEGFVTYYDYLAAEYLRKRGLLITALESAGMTPVLPAGGFFIMADTSHIEFPYDPLEVSDAMPASPMPRDWSMARWLTKEVGVTAIPPSAFYSSENTALASNLLRFAYCKGDATILQAHKRLEAYFCAKS
jgi:kynurenine--oxoglutarate transaminase/cysteine-S-conjugate beta-lyase/glutamine--phenylpyruvate transaminase